MTDTTAAATCELCGATLDEPGTCVGPCANAAYVGTLTVEDIEAGYDHDDWLGFGYLNGRTYLEDDDQAEADARLLAYANAHGWTAARLFTWCNSKPGRWYADDHRSPHAERLFADPLR